MLLVATGGGGGASGGYNAVDDQVGTSGTSSVGIESSNARKGGTGGQPGKCNSAGASFHGGVGRGWYAQGCDRKLRFCDIKSDAVHVFKVGLEVRRDVSASSLSDPFRVANHSAVFGSSFPLMELGI